MNGTTVESPAVVEFESDALWAALENFFEGSVREARQMRTRDFEGGDRFISRSMPFLDVKVDDKSYEACIHKIDKAGMCLAGSVITVAYFPDNDPLKYRYVQIQMTTTGDPFCPQAEPTAIQKKWEVALRGML